MRQVRNSFSVKRNRPAAVPSRKRPAMASATFASGWVSRPIAAVSTQSKGFRIQFAPILFMVMLAIGGLAVSVIARSREEVRNAKSHNILVKQQVDDFANEIHRLGDENAALGTNPEVIERLARERLGLVRPGELTGESK